MAGNEEHVNMEFSSRDKVLSRIKTALYGSANVSRPRPEPPAHEPGHFVRDKISIDSDENHQPEQRELIEIFTNELGTINGISKVVHHQNELQGYLSIVSTERDSKSFVVWKTALIDELKVIEYLKSNDLTVVTSDDKRELETADIGITEVDYAIADSGTLVLFSDPKKPRLTSLITPCHIAILDSKRIVPNIFDLFRLITQGYNEELHSEGITSCITFVTGPSRTADIELNLTLGVHGPKELHVLIYDK